MVFRALCRCFLVLGAACAIVLASIPSPAQEKTKKTEAEAKKAIQPKLVTIKAKGKLSKLLKDIQAKTGYEVVPPEGHDPEVEIDFKAVPYWQMLDKLAEQSDTRVNFKTEIVKGGDEARRVSKTILEKGYRELPVCYSGLFRMALTRIDSTRMLENDAHFSQATMVVAWEPGFQGFSLEPKPATLTVENDKGVVLEAPKAGRAKGSLSDGYHFTYETIMLPALRRPAAQYKRIKGSMSMVGAAEMLTFSFPTIAKGKQLTEKGVGVAISNLKTDKEQWMIELTMTYPPGGPEFETHEGVWLYRNEIALVDKDGKRYKISGLEVSPGGKQPVVNYGFADDDVLKCELSKLKLEYRTAGIIFEAPIDFDFKDVPAP